MELNDLENSQPIQIQNMSKSEFQGIPREGLNKLWLERLGVQLMDPISVESRN